MNPFATLIAQADWAGRNFNNNIGFIPADKFDWKPSPTAKSAQEIANHLLGSVRGITAAMGSGSDPAFMPVTNAEEAGQLMTSSVQGYISFLNTLTAEDMNRPVTLPFGELPLGVAASIIATELLHHHGQIVYIQTILGDTEDHLEM